MGYAGILSPLFVKGFSVHHYKQEDIPNATEFDKLIENKDPVPLRLLDWLSDLYTRDERFLPFTNEELTKWFMYTINQLERKQ